MARREFCLDLSRYHDRFTHGDLTVYATWHGNDLHPCLAIVPSYYEGHERVTPCIVPQRQAWLWAENIGDGAHCAFIANQFCDHLRMNRNMTNNFRISSVIRNHLGDLLAIPPAPFEFKVVADAFRTSSDGKQHHSEVRERV